MEPKYIHADPDEIHYPSIQAENKTFKENSLWIYPAKILIRSIMDTWMWMHSIILSGLLLANPKQNQKECELRTLLRVLQEQDRNP